MRLRTSQPLEPGRPSATLRKLSKLILENLRGPILDAPCGLGRNAVYLSEFGVDVYCLDSDASYLQFLESLPPNPQAFGRLTMVKADLLKEPLPFEDGFFSSVINVHFYSPAVINVLLPSLAKDGLLYIETVENRGENYLELPARGEIKRSLVPRFDFLYFEERPAGPQRSNRVTVKLLARKIS